MHFSKDDTRYYAAKLKESLQVTESDNLAILSPSYKQSKQICSKYSHHLGPPMASVSNQSQPFIPFITYRDSESFPLLPTCVVIHSININ